MTPFTHNTEGVWFNLTAEEYHAAPGFSFSQSCNMDPPARLPVYLAEKRVVTPWMRLGTMIHERILEPGKDLSNVVIRPETYVSETGETKPWNGNAKVCKRWYADAKNEGLDVVTTGELEKLNGCVESIREHPIAREALSEGIAEVSIFRNVILENGKSVFTKCRIDWVTGGDAIVDLKKVQSGKGSLEEFSWLVRDRSYHIQAASYLAAWNWAFPEDTKSKWVWVVVEEDAPYLVATHEARADLLGRGSNDYRSRLIRYSECVDERCWPGYPLSIGQVEWKFRKGDL
jgi:hypothetical protein